MNDNFPSIDELNRVVVNEETFTAYIRYVIYNLLHKYNIKYIKPDELCQSHEFTDITNEFFEKNKDVLYQQVSFNNYNLELLKIVYLYRYVCFMDFYDRLSNDYKEDKFFSMIPIAARINFKPSGESGLYFDSEEFLNLFDSLS
jgi:hypothetical protein